MSKLTRRQAQYIKSILSLRIHEGYPGEYSLDIECNHSLLPLDVELVRFVLKIFDDDKRVIGKGSMESETQSYINLCENDKYLQDFLRVLSTGLIDHATADLSERINAL